MTSLADYNLIVANQMSERQFQDVVTAAAERAGWLTYHTHDSRRSQKGFPDLVLVHPEHGLIFRELKTMKGKPTREQLDWIHALTLVGANAGIWRPIQWFDRTIDEILAQGSTR
ncbi:VRR-NUC domain-containing protein [Marisediminicola sp. LYQ134]|uniref:VRR-NUC domain-containing protein n=1 Tax=Marisediminicola sp. LYQ134 TaxID=3391061 RepID=UPI0039834B23